MKLHNITVRVEYRFKNWDTEKAQWIVPRDKALLAYVVEKSADGEVKGVPFIHNGWELDAVKQRIFHKFAGKSKQITLLYDPLFARLNEVVQI